MRTKEGLVLKGVLVAVAVVTAGVVLTLSFLPRATAPALGAGQAPAPLSVFCAPSSIPAGEHWVLLGSFKELPQDLQVTAATAGVSVLEVLRVSTRGVGVRLQTSLGAPGKLIRVSSASAASEVYPDLYQGQIPEPMTADANFAPGDLVDGYLVVGGKHFMYGYFETGESPLAAARIHNRSTGAWHSHEIALKKASEAARAPEPVGPEFQQQDPLLTLPDTDGNGVPDFADVEEQKEPVPDHLGVALVPGANKLDLVSVDEAGNASWRTIDVFTTYTPE